MYIDNINNKKFIDNRCKIQKNLEIDNTGIADNSTDLTAARNEYNILKQNNRICYPDSLDISGLSVSITRLLIAKLVCDWEASSTNADWKPA